MRGEIQALHAEVNRLQQELHEFQNVRVTLIDNDVSYTS